MMGKRAWVVAIFVACRGASRTVPANEAHAVDTSDASVATNDDASNPDASVLADVGVVEAEPPTRVTTVVTKWNDAHVAHDAAALRALYAPRVFFYGVMLDGATAADHKQTAFARAKDYSQTLRDVHARERGDRWVVTFTKSSTTAGKTTDQSSVLYVVGDHVTAEMDKLDAQWCYANPQLVVPPFTINETQAEAHAIHAHTFKGQPLGPKGPDYIPFVQELTCPDPTECSSGEIRTSPPPDDVRNPPCYFLTRIGIGSPQTAKALGGNGHQWLDMGSWVDGVTNVFWFQDWLGDAKDAWQRDPRDPKK